MYDHQERLEREFAPTLTHLAEVETQIAYHRSEIEKLNDIHRRLIAIAKIVDPEQFAPKPKKKTNHKQQVSQETLETAIAYLRTSYPDEQVYASLLVSDEGWRLSAPHTAKVLAELHEQGLIFLNAKGIGGRKLYRVVS